MPTNVFGIDIGTRLMKVALLEKSLRGHEIKSLKTRSVEGLDAEGISEELRSVITEMGYDSDDDRVAALFPAGKLSSRTIFVPLTRRQQIIETLTYEIESLTPFDAEDIVCDYVPIQASPEGTLLMAWIALRDDISSFLKIFHDAGVDPEMLIPAPSAAAALTGTGGEGGLALLDIGYGSTSVLLMIDGVPVAFHNTNAGTADLQPAPGENEPRQSLESFAAYIAVETRRLESAAGRSGQDVSIGRVVAVGGGADNAGARRALEAELGAKVESVEWSGDVEKSKVLAGAIGGALSLINEGGAGVNLGATGMDKRKSLSKNRAQATLAAVLFGLVAISYIISFAVDQARLDGRYEALKNSVRSEFHRALPDVKNIVSEKQQLKNALDEIRKKSRSLGGGLGERDMFLSRLNDLSLSAPKDMKLDVDELVYEPEKIIMSGRTESFEKVDVLKKNIEKLEWTRKVTVERAKAALAAGGINFRLEVETKA